jgi:hypothetical protein
MHWSSALSPTGRDGYDPSQQTAVIGRLRPWDDPVHVGCLRSADEPVIGARAAPENRLS